MLDPNEDRHLRDVRPLISPRALKSRLPLSGVAAQVVRRARRAIRDVIHGLDARRLVVVVGPCSIHDPKAALKYAQRLGRVAERLRGALVCVMRTYVEKPRTTIGWKGLINDPHLDGTCDVAAGLERARRLLLAINELGVPCASEILDPSTPSFVGDLLAWGAIGARTSESQTHRQLASGLSMPVGFKNRTDGELETTRDAIVAARHGHRFLGIAGDGTSAVVTTTGNPDLHLVLRGGRGRPNCGAQSVRRAAALARGEGIARPILIDCSHDNSGGDPARQPVVCREVLRQVGGGQRAIMGLMLESNLQPGRQRFEEGVALRYGVSITDACMGWRETEALLLEIAEVVEASQQGPQRPLGWPQPEPSRAGNNAA